MGGAGSAQARVRGAGGNKGGRLRTVTAGKMMPNKVTCTEWLAVATQLHLGLAVHVAQVV